MTGHKNTIIETKITFT